MKKLSGEGRKQNERGKQREGIIERRTGGKVLSQYIEKCTFIFCQGVDIGHRRDSERVIHRHNVDENQDYSEGYQGLCRGDSGFTIHLPVRRRKH